MMLILKKRSALLICFIILNSYIFSQDSLFQNGYATYYSDVFHGRRTASGERYNNKLHTAAHATLPLHTIVKVTNLKNAKSVIVKINDRCAKHKRNTIDLSKAAAKKIDLLVMGVVPVKIQILEKGDLHIINNVSDSLLIPAKNDTTGHFGKFDIYSLFVKQNLMQINEYQAIYSLYNMLYLAAYSNISGESLHRSSYYERLLCMIFPPFLFPVFRA